MVNSTKSASQRRDRALVEAELVSSVAWLIRLRWIAGIGVIFATWLVGAIFQLMAPRLPLYAVGAGILIYNLIFYIRERRLSQGRAPASDYDRLAKWQVGMDWLAMILLIHYTGGIESPVIFFFVFHIIIASIFFSPRTAFAFAFLAIGLVSASALFEYFGILPHEPIIGYLDSPLYQNGLYASAMLLFFGSTGLIAAYLGTSIQERLRKREHEIVSLTESLQRATTRLQALNDGARAVGSTLELMQVLNRLVQTTAQAMGVRACSIRLLDKSGRLLEPVAVFGLSQVYLHKGPVDALTNPLAREVLSGEVVNIPDAPNNPMLQYPEEARQEGIQSMLSAPLIGKEGPLGILRAYAVESNRFTPEDEAFLAAIAAQGSLAIENALAYKAVEELDVAKSQFVRMVTHELRSPVSVTQSLLRTLTAGYAGQITEQQQDILNRAARRVEFLQKLIDDLLDLAAGKMVVTSKEVREAVDLAAIVERVIRRFEVNAQEKSITLAMQNDSSGGATTVMANVEELDRAFNNLVSNAVKYTPPGGRVTVTLSQADEEAQVIVADTGIGIPEESMQHLFEEFYRAPNAKALLQEGTGLGLTIVKDIITRFGGRVTVQSTEGVGTTLIIFLPIVISDPAAVQISEPA